MVANDGRSALERLPAFAPDTVLLDIGMPEMDGYSVARRIRATPRFCQRPAHRPHGMGTGSGHPAGAGSRVRSPSRQAAGPRALATGVARRVGPAGWSAHAGQDPEYVAHQVFADRSAGLSRRTSGLRTQVTSNAQNGSAPAQVQGPSLLDRRQRPALRPVPLLQTDQDSWTQALERRHPSGWRRLTFRAGPNSTPVHHATFAWSARESPA